MGGFSANTAGWQLRFASSPPQDRLLRLGTALHCRNISNFRLPVVIVYKVFGAGIAPPTLDVPLQEDTELWVRWFVPGVVWFFERP